MTTRKLLLALVAALALHVPDSRADTPPTTTDFFTPQTTVGDAGDGYTTYYLPYFNLYTYSDANPDYIYKFDFGFLYFLGPQGGDLSSDEAYFYDFTEEDYLYTSASLYPYFYSFNRGTFLYYFEGSNPREFYDFNRGAFINY